MIIITTTGWLFHKDDEQVKIAASYYWEDGCCFVGEAIAIPRCAIKSPTHLRGTTS